jgi:hypothetical protein
MTEATSNLVWQRWRRGFTIGLSLLLFFAFGAWLSIVSWEATTGLALTGESRIPPTLHKLSPQDIEAITQAPAQLYPTWQTQLTQQLDQLRLSRRQTRIDKVESFFARYGSKLRGYGHIFVDKAQACGGDYRILVGIAGSESGLGRVMYKRFNPFGYLNGVQYSNQTEALNYLACQVSAQHIAPCGDNLQCLARRYAGPNDDHQHFINKVLWFAKQVD